MGFFGQGNVEMKILVTGGAGFIGTNFVYHIADKNYNIIVLDKLTYAGGRDNLAPLNKKIKLIVGDICDRKTVKTALKNIDWVAHFAAESHVTRSESDPDLFYKTNVEGTKVLLEQAKKAGVKRFLHISTDEIYGSLNDGYFKETDKIKGASRASSAYSKSKALADDLALEYDGGNMEVIVMRPTNNFGPWQFPEKALPRWITNLLTGEKIPLWGEGLQVRDWLFAPTTAMAALFLLQNGAAGEAYNIAANHQPEITNLQAAHWICEMLNLNPKKWIEKILDPRPHHDFRYALNIDKIKALGWSKVLIVRSQFEQTITWYQKNKKWWLKRKAAAEKIYQR